MPSHQGGKMHELFMQALLTPSQVNNTHYYRDGVMSVSFLHFTYILLLIHFKYLVSVHHCTCKHLGIQVMIL